jgi:hypothetical protein
MNKPQQGQTITLTDTAPVSAQFLGATGTVTRVLGNSIFISIPNHGVAIVHLAWGTKTDRRTLGFVAA